jgi:putative endonuclease
MWFVYTLYNEESDKIYIGETSNIERRLVEHIQKKGNHFTAKFEGKWVLIYKEEVLGRTQALKREKQLKSFRGREFVKQYIPR